MRNVAFITESVDAQAILTPIAEPATPPRMAPARAQPEWGTDCPDASFWSDDGAMQGDRLGQPAPQYKQLDPRASW